MDEELEIPEFLRRSGNTNSEFSDVISQPTKAWEDEPRGYARIGEPINIEGGEIPRDRTKAELIIDHFNFQLARKAKEFSAYAVFKKQDANKSTVRAVEEYFSPLLEEFGDDYDEDDKWYGDTIRLLTTIVDDCSMFLTNTKVSRKKRKIKPKEVTIAKAASKLHYMKESTEFKIVSIDPIKIAGATELWLFNTKYKELHRLVSQNPEGFSMKGTTIIGVDETASQRKRLKKPLEFLPNVVEMAKIPLKKAYDNLNTRVQPGLPRLTEHVVILRAIK
jgi:hypothetical protein